MLLFLLLVQINLIMGVARMSKIVNIVISRCFPLTHKMEKLLRTLFDHMSEWQSQNHVPSRPPIDDGANINTILYHCIKFCFLDKLRQKGVQAMKCWECRQIGWRGLMRNITMKPAKLWPNVRLFFLFAGHWCVARNTKITPRVPYSKNEWNHFFVHSVL